MTRATFQPQWSMTQPPTGAPIPVETTPASASRALAASSWPGGTISGVIALLAGRKNTLQVNRANTSANIGDRWCPTR